MMAAIYFIEQIFEYADQICLWNRGISGGDVQTFFSQNIFFKLIDFFTFNVNNNWNL